MASVAGRTVLDKDRLASQLQLNGGVIQPLLRVMTKQARWRPEPDRWSLLEVINHPDQTYPPIDPMKWVVFRGYNQRELEASLKGFLTERARRPCSQTPSK